MPPSRRPPTSRANTDRIGGPKVARSFPGGKRQDRRELSMPPGRAPTSSNTTGGCAKKTVVPNTLLCDGVFFAEGEKGTLGFWPLPPLELLGKLTALTPRPRINLVLYHGVLAPHAGWRSRVVAYRAPQVEAPAVASASANANGEPAAAPPSRHWAWADLMRRAFDIDVLACPRCGGRMRLIGTVEDPDAIRAILAALAASRERADRAPPFAASLDTSHTAAISA